MTSSKYNSDNNNDIEQIQQWQQTTAHSKYNSDNNNGT